jgi:hypothetical protein
MNYVKILHYNKRRFYSGYRYLVSDDCTAQYFYVCESTPLFVPADYPCPNGFYPFKDTCLNPNQLALDYDAATVRLIYDGASNNVFKCVSRPRGIKLEFIGGQLSQEKMVCGPQIIRKPFEGCSLGKKPSK